MEKYYKTELHAHSSPASGCSDVDPREVARLYKKAGYDSIVLTNHFIPEMKGESVEKIVEWYLKDYYECYDEGVKIGINVILGAEIRFTENSNDYLIYGICPEDLADIYKLLPYGIDNFYREYKNDKSIIIQAHPFRNGMESVSPKSLDGIEVFNMHTAHNSRIGIAAKYADENNMIAICGSDFHHVGQEGLCAVLTQKPLMDSYNVADVLKSRDYDMTVGKFIVKI